VLAVAVLAAIGIAVRRTVLEHGGGTVECGLRRNPDDSWRLGLADYQPDELRWYKVFGFRLRPEAVFARSGMSIISRRPADAAEAASLGDGTVIVECTVGAPAGRSGTQVELAMSEAALTGFLAWLEAAPPSADMPDLV
jgi:ribosomal protein L34